MWERLALHANAAIRQCIELQCNRTSTAHRLALTSSGIWLTAGAEHDIFSDGAIDEVYRFSSGACPANKVCTHCLIYGTSKTNYTVNRRHYALAVT
ncbi:hypothetical protein IJ22_06960 [Paenibacillus naphthalenovorans]|uniref:Uncharacterized protein n=1 Tax=Paenibacillus naphthalenovorans TaxID=162209 RepID=A0A0U2U422_9BACL|nr:hypothetical protein IJ22_06960 [Paenibacillus naphthalenovorans]